MQNKIWLGESIHSGDREFKVPDYYPLKAAGWRVDDEGNRYIRVKGVRWFTNINHGLRHQPLSLMSMADNKMYSKHKEVKDHDYLKYVNYDALDVPYTDSIPADYDGVMGVPITFLDKYNPDQYEILNLGIGTFMAGHPLGKPFVDLYKQQGGTGHISSEMFGLALIDTNGRAKVPYGRVLIRKRR